jgi:hypothetical protein
MHHDALKLPNGEFVYVTRLCEGQTATVIQLPAGNAHDVVVPGQVTASTTSPVA